MKILFDSHTRSYVADVCEMESSWKRGRILARNKYEKSSASVHNPIKITTEWIYKKKRIWIHPIFPTERASKQQNFSLENKQIPIHPHSRAAVIMRNNNIFFSTRKSFVVGARLLFFSA